MALCCRSGGCHENGRHEAPSDSIMESIMESLANCVANMLLGEHIVQQTVLPDTILVLRKACSVRCICTTNINVQATTSRALARDSAPQRGVCAPPILDMQLAALQSARIELITTSTTY